MKSLFFTTNHTNLLSDIEEKVREGSFGSWSLNLRLYGH